MPTTSRPPPKVQRVIRMGTAPEYPSTPGRLPREPLTTLEQPGRVTRRSTRRHAIVLGSHAGAPRSSQDQPGAARASQERPGPARSSQEQPGAAKSSQEQPEAARSSQGIPKLVFVTQAETHTQQAPCLTQKHSNCQDGTSTQTTLDTNGPRARAQPACTSDNTHALLQITLLGLKSNEANTIQAICYT